MTTSGISSAVKTRVWVIQFRKIEELTKRARDLVCDMIEERWAELRE